MTSHTPGDVATPQAPSRRKRIWIGLAGGVCLLSWLALGAGILLDVGRTTMFALVTLAAVTTEGAVWLTAVMFGVSAYQARRKIWQKLRHSFR